MKQKQFVYYWENINNNIIVADVRTGKAMRVYKDNKREETTFTSHEWAGMCNDDFLIRVSRAAARRWFKNNEQPLKGLN